MDFGKDGSQAVNDVMRVAQVFGLRACRLTLARRMIRGGSLWTKSGGLVGSE